MRARPKVILKRLRGNGIACGRSVHTSGAFEAQVGGTKARFGARKVNVLHCDNQERNRGCQRTPSPRRFVASVGRFRWTTKSRSTRFAAQLAGSSTLPAMRPASGTTLGLSCVDDRMSLDRGASVGRTMPRPAATLGGPTNRNPATRRPEFRTPLPPCVLS